MEQRLKQYHEEVLKGRTNKSYKQMNQFRTFIHKNQNYDFTDREKVRLFSIVEGYFTMFDRNTSANAGEEEDGKQLSSFPLIEDCLKNTMLKWYEELTKRNNPTAGKEKEKEKEQKPKNKYYDDDEDEEEYLDEEDEPSENV